MRIYHSVGWWQEEKQPSPSTMKSIRLSLFLPRNERVDFKATGWDFYERNVWLYLNISNIDPITQSSWWKGYGCFVCVIIEYRKFVRQHKNPSAQNWVIDRSRDRHSGAKLWYSLLLHAVWFFFFDLIIFDEGCVLPERTLSAYV